jgi:hypothetical protein
LGDGGVNQQAEQLRRDISRVQLLAISQARRFRVATTTSGYSVLTCTAPSICSTVPVNDPVSGQPFVVALSGDVAFTTPSQLEFDSFGRPVAANLLATVTTFTLARASHSVRVEVSPLTGYALLVN